MKTKTTKSTLLARPKAHEQGSPQTGTEMREPSGTWFALLDVDNMHDVFNKLVASSRGRCHQPKPQSDSKRRVQHVSAGRGQVQDEARGANKDQESFQPSRAP
eukprot:scaffold30_cov255-Pinguiococcus_pyrenoidosus.AAC.15